MTTPLAAALPGYSGHYGDGVYTLETESHKTAVVVSGSSINALSNETDLINEYILETGLPEYPVDDGEVGRFQSSYSTLRDRARRATSYIVLYSFIATLIGVAIYVAATISIGYSKAREEKASEEFERSVQQAISEIRTTSPLSEVIATFQSRASTAVRAGGWIDYYNIKNKEDHFRVYLPQWVTRDYVLALGERAKADKTALNDTMIQVVMGTPIAEQPPKIARDAAGPLFLCQ